MVFMIGAAKYIFSCIKKKIITMSFLVMQLPKCSNKITFKYHYTNVRNHGGSILKMVWYIDLHKIPSDDSTTNLAGWPWGMYYISESHFLICGSTDVRNCVPLSWATLNTVVLLSHTLVSTFSYFLEWQNP